MDPGDRLLRFLSEIFTEIDPRPGFLSGGVEAARASVKIEGEVKAVLRMVAIRVVAEDFTINDSTGEKVIFVPLPGRPV